MGRGESAHPFAGLACSEDEDRAPALIPLLSLSEEDFRLRFQGRAIMRAKRDGLLRNACVVLGNLRDDRAVGALTRALDDASVLVRGHAAWALGQIGNRACGQALARRGAVEADPWVREEIDAALSGCRADPTGAES